MTSAIILLNPHAGQGQALALRQPMQRWLEHHAPAVPLLVPDNPDEALATLLITAQRTRVVLVGGTGTVQAMLPSLTRRHHRLGLVPAGRHNDLAASLGLTRIGWSEALRYALHAPALPIDLGHVETEQGPALFCSSLACGHDALATELAQQAPGWLGRGIGRSAGAALRTLLTRPAQDLRIWADGRAVHDGPLALAAVLNTSTYHGDAQMAPAAQPDDQQLELLLLRQRRHLGLLRLLPWLHAHRPASIPIERHGCRKLLFAASTPTPLLLDGELRPSAQRFTVQLLPRALKVARQSG
ncbi:MAG: hypothetical protein RJA44_931 [Pseudomonadota bacterium]